MFSDTNLLSQNPLQHVSFGNVSFPFIGSPSCPVFIQRQNFTFWALNFAFQKGLLLKSSFSKGPQPCGYLDKRGGTALYEYRAGRSLWQSPNESSPFVS